jgi:hypothetical protein
MDGCAVDEWGEFLYFPEGHENCPEGGAGKCFNPVDPDDLSTATLETETCCSEAIWLLFGPADEPTAVIPPPTECSEPYAFDGCY